MKQQHSASYTMPAFKPGNLLTQLYNSENQQMIYPTGIS